MLFPVQFLKRQGDFDFIAPVVNFAGNAMIVSAAALAAGVIVQVALEALGCSGAALAASTTLFWAVGIIAGLGAAAGAGILAAVLVTFMKAMLCRGWNLHPGAA